MKPVIALLALFTVGCGGSSGGSGGGTPTTPTSPGDQVDGGQWSIRTPLIEANSELALAELNGRLYLVGGYPASRITARTVQVYDIANSRWELGPPLPQPNNHGMAAGVNGRVYLIGGQTMADAPTYVDTVYELDPGKGSWVEKARMPTARSSGVAIVHDGKIYVAGGRPPRGYDPRTDKWIRLRDMPIPVHGVYGSAFVDGLIWASGGGTSIGGSFGSLHNQVFMPSVSCD